MEQREREYDMPSYLERYVSGEHEAVWDELITLGSQVWEEPLRSDAYAVAQEIMRRVRQNLETLIPRLMQIGYQFGYGWVQPSRKAPFDWQKRKAYKDAMELASYQDEILGTSVDTAAKLHHRTARLDRLISLEAPRIILDNERRIIAELKARPPQQTLIDELEALMDSPITLALRAWFEFVDGVNFVGMHPDWLRTLLVADPTISRTDWESTGFDPEEGGLPFARLEPMYVHSLDYVASHVREVASRVSPERRLQALELIPNGNWSYFARESDNWECLITPAPTVDGPVAYSEPEVSFVGYLRRCIRWGGFPGWERLSVRPERALALLTEGLIPF